MGIYFRQVCLVADQLAPVIDALKYVFELNTAYIDDEVAHFGLENTLLGVGSQLIEVVAPIQDDTSAGRYLQRQGGDGGYMVIGQVLSQAEQAACRARASENGVRVAWENARPGWHMMQLHPRDMQAAFFEVDWEAPADPTGHWSPAGGATWQDTVSQSCVQAITSLTLEGPDPDSLAKLWGRVADVPVGYVDDVPILELENVTLRFVSHAPTRSPRLIGVGLKASDVGGSLRRAKDLQLAVTADAVEIGGVWFGLDG